MSSTYQILSLFIKSATFILRLCVLNSENAPNFQALPTFGSIINYFTGSIDFAKPLVPNFDKAKMLHGEQYLELLQIPIPTSATLVSETRVLEVIDKGSAALVKTGTTSIDQATNRKSSTTKVPLFYVVVEALEGTGKALREE